MSDSNRSLHIEILEFKARIPNATALASVRDKLVRANACKRGVFRQVDTYFEVPIGRLKLREVDGQSEAELIFYQRENRYEPRVSSVIVLEIARSVRPRLKQVLKKILKTKAVVDKIREIYQHEAIEIHLDNVENLGFFVEFELRLAEDSSQLEACKSNFKKLREQLGITSHSLEKLSYGDLI
ncbi:MAG: class IV adenylate cyclase [Candidatus Bathyarchaeota archaeon]|nr:class IV adenylate cyclase [Candidatus Bathyarchaeota archaeon]